MKYFTTIIFTLILGFQASFLSAKIDVENSKPWFTITMSHFLEL
jgi:hypothetical protein